MVADLLVEPTVETPAFLLDAGWRLLETLDTKQVPVQAALWRYKEESVRWSLYLALPMVEAKGQVGTYLFLHSVIDSLPSDDRVTLIRGSIVVVPPGDKLVRELREVYGSINGTRGRRDRVTALQEDVFIYRL